MLQSTDAITSRHVFLLGLKTQHLPPTFSYMFGLCLQFILFPPSLTIGLSIQSTVLTYQYFYKSFLYMPKPLKIMLYYLLCGVAPILFPVFVFLPALSVVTLSSVQCKVYLRATQGLCSLCFCKNQQAPYPLYFRLEWLIFPDTVEVSATFATLSRRFLICFAHFFCFATVTFSYFLLLFYVVFTTLFLFYFGIYGQLYTCNINHTSLLQWFQRQDALLSRINNNTAWLSVTLMPILGQIYLWPSIIIS